MPMSHIALTTTSSKGQYILQIKVPPLFTCYTSGCPCSFFPCRVAFLHMEGSSAWWQQGSSMTGTDQSCHRELQRRSWVWSRALDFQGDSTTSGDRASTTWGDTPIQQPTPKRTNWSNAYSESQKSFVLTKKQLIGRLIKNKSLSIFPVIRKTII